MRVCFPQLGAIPLSVGSLVGRREGEGKWRRGKRGRASLAHCGHLLPLLLRFAPSSHSSFQLTASPSPPFPPLLFRRLPTRNVTPPKRERAGEREREGNPAATLGNGIAVSAPPPLLNNPLSAVLIPLPEFVISDLSSLPPPFLSNPNRPKRDASNPFSSREVFQTNSYFPLSFLTVQFPFFPFLSCRERERREGKKIYCLAFQGRSSSPPLSSPLVVALRPIFAFRQKKA